MKKKKNPIRSRTTSSGTSVEPVPQDAGDPQAPVGETLDDLRSDIGDPSGSDPAGPQERGAKRRGRPPGSKTKPKEEDVQLDPRVFGPLVAFPFDYVAARRGDHWKLAPEERTMLADLTASVASKYMGTLAARYGAELALATAIVTIVGARIMLDAQAQKAIESTEPVAA